MKPYPLAPDRYLVSPNGEVISLPNKTRHKPVVLAGKIRTKDGRKEYLLFIDGKRVYKQAHCMVLETYIGPRPVGFDACHNDGDPLNNSLENLRWDTRAGNFADKVRHGTNLKGEAHGRCKTTLQQVKKFKKLLAKQVSIKVAAKKCEMQYNLAYQIAIGKNWAHVTC